MTIGSETMLLTSVLSWVQTAITEVFMLVFDTIVYGIAIAAICIFNGIARMDFFSTKAGAYIYSDITYRVYGIIGIIMIFFFTYQLIMMVINPDGKEAGASSQLVKRLITSIIMIAFFPTLYHYMAVFQEHVLTEGTIFGIVTGTASGGDSDTMGRNTALIVYLSMYHPVGGGYQSLVENAADENGNIVLKTAEECVKDSNASLDTCKLWVEAVDNFVNKKENGILGGITAFTLNWSLTETIFEDDGSEYYYVVIVICGAVLAWFYISYAIDLGYRTVKLGFLQIISPAPLVIRIFEGPGGVMKSSNVYGKWRHQLFVTYVEVFARVAIVAFVITLIQYVPIIVAGLFENLLMSRAYIGFAVVALIFGIFKFGKELPKLAKDLFNTGSGIFDNINWKPGVGHRLKAGTDEVVGFAKKAGTWAASKVIKGAATVGGIKKVVRGVKGAAEGIKLGAEAFKKANGSAKGTSAVIGQAVAGAKGAAAAWNASKNVSTKTPWNVARQIMNSASSNAGGSVKAQSLGEIIMDQADKVVNGGTMNANQLKVGELVADNKKMVNGVDDELGISDKIKKIKERGQQAEAAFYAGGGKPVKGAKLNSKGEAIGDIEFSSSDELRKYYKDMEKQAYLDTFRERLNEGVESRNFDGLLKALTGSGFDTLSGIQALDLPDGSKEAYAKKISSNFDSSSIEKINELLGTSFDPEMALPKIKAHNKEIDLKNKDLEAEIAELGNATVESLTAAINEAKASGMKNFQGHAIGDNINVSAMANQIFNDNQTRIAEKQAQIETNNSGRIDESNAVHLSMDDINTLVSKIGNNAKNVFTIPDKIEIKDGAGNLVLDADGKPATRDLTPDEKNQMLEQNTQLIKDIRDMINTMSSNGARDILREFEAPKNEKSDNKGDAKA